MNVEDIITYRLTIDEESDIALDGSDITKKTNKSVGMYRVAQVVNPAVLQKGFYFNQETNKQEKVTKSFIFSSQLKLRITSPVIIPNLIMPRYDSETDELFNVMFTEDDAEKIYKKFMVNLKETNIFQDEHTDKKSNSYLLETMIIDSESKQEYVKQAFDWDLPLNSVIQTVQYRDEESFVKAIENNQTGLSLEGLFSLIPVNLRMSKDVNKNKKEHMLKTIYDNKFVAFESLEVDGKVFNFENEEDVLSFEFEHEGNKYTIENNVITNVTKLEDVNVNEDVKPTEVDQPTETKVEEDEDKPKVEVEVEEDEDEPKEVAFELTEEAVTNMINTALEGVYDAIAQIKAESIQPKKENEDEIIKPAQFSRVEILSQTK